MRAHSINSIVWMESVVGCSAIEVNYLNLSSSKSPVRATPLISKNLPSFPAITARFQFRGASVSAHRHISVIELTPERIR